MANNLSEIIEILDFINDIIGTTKKIIINSHIYDHDSNNHDQSHKPKKSKYDIYTIDGTIKPIEYVDILKVFKKMQRQFKNTYAGRSYAFEGLQYNTREQYYELCWGS